MAYATVAHLLGAYDARRVRELVSDSGQPSTLGDLDDHPVLLQLLDEAADLILAACLVGKRYSVADLAALADSTTTGFLLRRLNADLAYGLLACRRGVAADQVARLAPLYVTALQTLDQLRRGEILFPRIDDTHPAAALPRCADLLTSPVRDFPLPGDAVRLFGVRPGTRPAGPPY